MEIEAHITSGPDLLRSAARKYHAVHDLPLCEKAEAFAKLPTQ
jgi:hypothetical protein